MFLWQVAHDTKAHRKQGGKMPFWLLSTPGTDFPRSMTDKIMSTICITFLVFIFYSVLQINTHELKTHS